MGRYRRLILLVRALGFFCVRGRWRGGREVERDREVLEVLGAWREWRQAEAELHSAAAAMDHWTGEAAAEFDRAHKRKDAAWTKVSFLLDRLSVSVLRDE